MTSIEVVSLVLKMIKKDEFLTEEVENLEKSLQTIDRLDGIIIENTILPRFVEILFKFDNQTKHEERSINILNVVKLLTQKSRLLNFNAFTLIAKILTNKIYDFQENKFRNASERLNCTTLNCIETLAKSLTSEAIEGLFVSENRPNLGELVHVCLECISFEQGIKVRIAAINCLMAILQIHDTVDMDDVVLRDQISGTIFVMTPKICGVLFKVVEADLKTPQKIRAKALQAVGRYLCLIFEDTETSKEIPINVTDFKSLINPKAKEEVKKTDSEVLGSDLKSIEAKTKFMTTAKKSKDWLKSALHKIRPFLDRLPTLLLPEFGSKVHDELSNVSSLLAQRCSKNMASCLPILYEILLVLSTNATAEMSKKCKETLNFMAKEYPNAFKTQMQSGWEVHLRRLSRIIFRQSESQLLIGLQLLKAYLLYFSENNSFIITNPETFNLFFNNLVILFEIKYPTIVLDEAVEWNDMDIIVKSQKSMPWRQLKYIEGNEALENTLNEICAVLSHASLLHSISNAVFDKLVDDTNASNEIMCLLLRLLEQNCNKNSHLVKLVLDEFLLEKHWYLEIRLNEHLIAANRASKEELQFNVLHICLAIEVVTSCARYIDDKKEQYLFNVLPKLLEKIGGSNILIHNASLHGLDILAKGLKYLDVRELMQNNSDFISHYIGVRLKRQDIKNSLDMTNAFLQLHACLEDFTFIRSLFYTMMDVLTKQLKDDSVACALKILLILLRKLIVHDRQADRQPNSYEERPLVRESLYEKCRNLLNIRETPEKMAENIELNFEEMEREMKHLKTVEENDEANVEEIPNENDETETPQNKFIRDLIHNCLGYISAPNITHKLFALEVISNSLVLLDHTHKEFLPTVHLIWQPLSLRFKEKNLLIVSRTFDLLTIISRFAKDFIQKRTSKDVLPYIIEILRNGSKENLENTGTFASTLTQGYKLQHKIFKNIGEIVRNLEIHEKDLDNLLDACLVYWNGKSPKELREACLELLRNLYRYDATAVLLKFYNVEEFC